MKIQKAFELKGLLQTEDMDLVAKYVKDEEVLKTCKVYSAVAYTDEVDRDNEQVNKEGLNVMAEKVIGKPICLDHCSYCADGIIGRVIKAEVETNDSGVSSLVVKFYTPFKEAQEKIESGIYYNVSLGFGADIESTTDDGIRHLKVFDVYELSVVCVPAVRDAHIKSLNKGGYTMTFKEFKLKQFKINHPEMAETIKAFEDIEDKDALTDADIEQLFNENEELKKKVAELEDTIREYKNGEFNAECKEAVDTEIDKSVDEFGVDNAEVKEVITEELKSYKYTVEVVETGEQVVTKSGHKLVVNGLAEAIDTVKAKYTKLGLIGQAKKQEVKEKNLDFTVKNTEVKQSNSFIGQTFKIN